MDVKCSRHILLIIPIRMLLWMLSASWNSIDVLQNFYVGAPWVSSTISFAFNPVVEITCNRTYLCSMFAADVNSRVDKEDHVSVVPEHLGAEVSDHHHNTVPTCIQHPCFEAINISKSHSTVDQVADELLAPLGLESRDISSEQRIQSSSGPACEKSATAHVAREDSQGAAVESTKGGVCFEKLPLQPGMQNYYVFDPIQNQWEVKAGIPQWYGGVVHNPNNPPISAHSVPEHLLAGHLNNRGDYNQIAAQNSSKATNDSNYRTKKQWVEGPQTLYHTGVPVKETIVPQYSAPLPCFDARQPMVLCPLSSQCKSPRVLKECSMLPQQTRSGPETTEQQGLEYVPCTKPFNDPTLMHKNSKVYVEANQVFDDSQTPVEGMQYTRDINLGQASCPTASSPSFLPQNGQKKHGFQGGEYKNNYKNEQQDPHICQQFERDQRQEFVHQETHPQMCCNHYPMNVEIQGSIPAARDRRAEPQQNSSYNRKSWMMHNTSEENCEGAAKGLSHLKQAERMPASAFAACKTQDDISAPMRRSGHSVRVVDVSGTWQSGIKMITICSCKL